MSSSKTTSTSNGTVPTVPGVAPIRPLRPDTGLPELLAGRDPRSCGGLEAALTAWHHTEPTRAGAGTERTSNRVVARCECGRQFRITVSVLELGPIVRAVCGTPFENTTPDVGDEPQDQTRDQEQGT